jgi:hypothetical protein
LFAPIFYVVIRLMAGDKFNVHGDDKLNRG